MGKSNAAIRGYIAQKEHIADIFNNYLFEGEEIIKPEELEAIDGENDVLIDDKHGREQEIHRYRDITMKWKYGMDLMILACENQQKIHYAMPVRNMLYDSLSYVGQIKEIWNQSKEKKMTSEEYLSKFRKEDRLLTNETIRQYISNYKINLMDVGNLESVDKFRTDLQIVFGMLKYRSNTEKLMDYVKDHEDYYKKLDIDTYRAIREFLHSEKRLREVLRVIEEEGETVDMCKALDDLYNMGVEKGREETEEKMCKALEDYYQQGIQKGREETEEKMCKALEDYYQQGIQKGREEIEEKMSRELDTQYQRGIQKGREEAEYKKLIELAGKMVQKGWSAEEIADTFEESLEIIQEIMLELVQKNA